MIISETGVETARLNNSSRRRDDIRRAQLMNMAGHVSNARRKLTYRQKELKFNDMPLSVFSYRTATRVADENSDSSSSVRHQQAVLDIFP